MVKNHDNPRQELGARIRGLRKSAGFTLEYMEEKSGLNCHYIGQLERGRANVSLDSLVKIADALGVKVGDFFSTEKIPVQKVFIEPVKKDPLSRLSASDVLAIKKSLRILSRIFSKANLKTG